MIVLRMVCCIAGFSALGGLTACSHLYSHVYNPALKEPERPAAVAPERRPVPSPGSIWEGDTRTANLFLDQRARYLHDLVTVKIVENAKGSKSASTKTAKDASDKASVESFFGIPSHLGVKSFLGLGNVFNPGWETATKNEFDGSGSTSRDGVLTAVVTARVVQVLPNGNLVIEGRREVMINNEKQYLVLSGVIRPEDVGPNNVVLSTAIADAKIVYTGRGVVAEKQHTGWGTRVLDYAWPF